MSQRQAVRKPPITARSMSNHERTFVEGWQVLALVMERQIKPRHASRYAAKQAHAAAYRARDNAYPGDHSAGGRITT